MCGSFSRNWNKLPWMGFVPITQTIKYFCVAELWLWCWERTEPPVWSLWWQIRLPAVKQAEISEKRTDPGGRHPKINQRRTCISSSDKHKTYKQQKSPFFSFSLQSSWMHVSVFVQAVMWVQTRTSMLVGQRVWSRQIGRVKDHSCLEISPWTYL